MTGVVVPLLALISGWGWIRLLHTGKDAASRISGATVLAVVVTGGWLSLLDLVGIPWTLSAVAVGWLPGLLLALLPGLQAFGQPWRAPHAQESPGGLSPWAAMAAVGVGARAVAVGAVPAFGWDFRYIWGLKARVFAMAGAHDLGWLAQSSHSFAHPDYPPLWPDLMAAGITAGAPAGKVAAGWGAVLALGLGAACWRLARPAGRPLAALAALTGAWFPTLLAPHISYSGSAEPLAAFLFAAALTATAWSGRNTGSWPLLAAALAALAVTKNEGSVLALLLVVCVLHRVGKRQRPWVVAAAVAPLALWQLTVTAAGIPRLGADLDPARMISRAAAMPGTILSITTPVLLLEILGVALVLTAPRFGGSRPLKLMLTLWLAAVGLAYLSSPHDLHWHLETSLQRILVIPLPALLALVLGSVFREEPEPASTRR